MKFVISSRFSFEIRFGRKILQICLSQLWWKLDSALISVFVTLQHSLPYSRTDFTLLLYSLIFVFRLYCLDFQMGRNLWNADLACCKHGPCDASFFVADGLLHHPVNGYQE